jgi:hypothetical protein
VLFQGLPASLQTGGTKQRIIAHFTSANPFSTSSSVNGF